VNTVTNRELEKAAPITADLAAFAEMPSVQQEAKRDLNEPVLDNHNSDVRTEEKQLAPLFLPDVAKEFRSHWDTVQRGFVDDPRHAVRQGDELVGQVMKSLAETFSNERAMLEGRLDQTDEASTETLRLALRRYRSFFERLLSF
jgi:hypothetical protein